jgi:trehalose 6-phosphate synthase/phosphatase
MVKERKGHSMPSDAMIKTISELCADKKNTVLVVSGKERHALTKTLGHIPRLGLAAEHGMFISWPTAKRTERHHWEPLVPITDRTWRSLAMGIMEVYTSRTHGSYIEETEMKVLWQYRDADLEFGYLQARELEDHLSNVLRNYPVDILHGGVEEGGYVEVRPKGVNKGVCSMKVIKSFPNIAQSDKVEFALVLGDDHCDEPMLSVMRQIGRRVNDSRRVKKGDDPLPDLPASMTLVDVSGCDEYLAPHLEVFTCTVGKKPSAAANYLHDVNEVQELLEALVKVSTRDQKYYSSIDLRNFQQDNLGVANTFDRFDNTLAEASGMKRPMSMGSMEHLSALDPSESTTIGDNKISANLGEYLGAIEDGGEEEEEPFFF